MNLADIRNRDDSLRHVPFPQVQHGNGDKGGVSRTSYPRSAIMLRRCRKGGQNRMKHLFLSEIGWGDCSFERKSL
jgi:hypothetical protein